MDTTTQQPYPMCRLYPWERIGVNAQHVKFWQSVALKTKGSAKNPRAVVAWKKVLERLEDNASGAEPTTEYTPAEFKALLVQAARDAVWLKAPSARKGFTAKVEGDPTKRRCSGCEKVKDVGDFRAEASDKRKATYNWGRDGQPTAAKRFYTHALCSTCRADKKRRPLAKMGTPKGAALRKQMEVPLKLSQRFLAQFDGVEPEDIVDQRYYFHKMRLDAIRNARLTLDTLEGAEQEIPHLWQLLIPTDLRHRIYERFEQDVMPLWSGKGKEPKCF